MDGVIANNVRTTWGSVEHLNRSEYVGFYLLAAKDENARTQVSAELPPEMKGVVQPGMPVRFEGLKGSVETVYETESVIGILVRMGKDFAGLPDGTYDGLIVTDSTTPVGFLLGEE